MIELPVRTRNEYSLCSPSVHSSSRPYFHWRLCALRNVKYYNFIFCASRRSVHSPRVAAADEEKDIYVHVIFVAFAHIHFSPFFSLSIFFFIYWNQVAVVLVVCGVRTQMIAIKFEYLLWGQSDTVRFIFFALRSVRSFCGTRCCCGWLCFFALIHSAKGKRNKFVSGRLV